ncbi:MAG: acyl-ACP--UDP-N-acetylglucosamine O-acyltransferase [Planctomycetota bacterium]|jgi:UDP-N-acetylglucosamine acyltransferase
MSRAKSARIHPAAHVSPDAIIGENVEIGAFALIEGSVTIGDDCVIRPGAYLYGPLTMGRGNVVHTGAILGDAPQHTKYKGERTSVVIGDDNIIRENATIHRGTASSYKTVIGNNNFLMVGAHIAHDCVVGNRCILTNGSMLGGHCVLEDNVIISGNSAVHQFARVGRLAMLAGLSGSTKDIPPFIIQQGIDTTSGVNVIGMRRAGLSNEQINAVREAFRTLYRRGLPLPAALAKLQHNLGHIDVVQEMIGFINGASKGVAPMRSRFREEAA